MCTFHWHHCPIFIFPIFISFHLVAPYITYHFHLLHCILHHLVYRIIQLICHISFAIPFHLLTFSIVFIQSFLFIPLHIYLSITFYKLKLDYLRTMAGYVWRYFLPVDSKIGGFNIHICFAI
jgi:hypothetical protein